MLQVKGETQVNFERENKTLFLSCLSFEKKSHPSGWTYIGWLLSSEIAGREPSSEDQSRGGPSHALVDGWQEPGPDRTRPRRRRETGATSGCLQRTSFLRSLGPSRTVLPAADDPTPALADHSFRRFGEIFIFPFPPSHFRSPTPGVRFADALFPGRRHSGLGNPHGELCG